MNGDSGDSWQRGWKWKPCFLQSTQPAAFDLFLFFFFLKNGTISIILFRLYLFYTVVKLYSVHLNIPIDEHNYLLYHLNLLGYRISQSRVSFYL